MLDRPDPGPDRDSADPRTAPSANIMEIMELDEQYDGFGAGDKSKARYGTRNAYRVWVPCIMMGVRSIQSTKGKQTLVIRTLVVVPQLYFSDFLQICFFSFSLCDFSTILPSTVFIGGSAVSFKTDMCVLLANSN